MIRFASNLCRLSRKLLQMTKMIFIMISSLYTNITTSVEDHKVNSMNRVSSLKLPVKFSVELCQSTLRFSIVVIVSMSKVMVFKLSLLANKFQIL